MNAEPNNSSASFTVTATWDPEAGVFFSQSDIPGLHVEAATFDELLHSSATSRRR